jgi:hypothetical protein
MNDPRVTAGLHKLKVHRFNMLKQRLHGFLQFSLRNRKVAVLKLALLAKLYRVNFVNISL